MSLSTCAGFWHLCGSCVVCERDGMNQESPIPEADYRQPCTSLGQRQIFLEGKHCHVLQRVSETCCSWWVFMQPSFGYFHRKQNDI